LKLERVKDKLRRYEESQEKIKKNQELEAQILKAQLRIDELINQKRGFERQQVQNANQIQNFEDKISKNTDLITKIGQEFEREKVYKL